MKQVNLAIHYDPLNRDSIVLRNEIIAAGGFEDESIHEYLHKGLLPFSGRHHNYSKRGYPWKDFDGLNPPDVSSVEDPGMTGNVRTVVRPAPVPSNVFEPGTVALPRPTRQPETLPTPQNFK